MVNSKIFRTFASEITKQLKGDKIMRVELNLILDVEVADNSITTSSMLERVDNLISDSLNGVGDDVVTINSVETE